MNITKYTIERKYIQIQDNTRSGARLVSGEPGFFVAHDTGDPGATALGEWEYFNDLVGRDASAHTFIDDKHIIEFIPTGTGKEPAERAWHVIYDVPTDNQLFGDDANDIAIGTELCWGGRIDFKEAYARYVWYHAYLCYRFKKDPRKAIIGHEQLDPARKIDPSNALNRYGITYEQFIQDVVCELNEEEDEDNMVVKLDDSLWIGLEQWIGKAIEDEIIHDLSWAQKIKDRSITAGEIAALKVVVDDRRMAAGK